MVRHITQEVMVRSGQLNIQASREVQRATLQADIDSGGQVDPDTPLKLALLQNDIAQGDFDAQETVPVQLTDNEKTVYSNAWQSYHERNTSLLKYRGQAYSLILG